MSSSSAGFRNRYSVGLLAGVMALGFSAVSLAQDKNAGSSDNNGAATERGNQVDPLKRPIPEKQKKKNAKALKVELSKTYQKWLDEDVRWIITDEEHKAFKQLSQRRRARPVHRSFLAAPRPHARHRRERI